MPVMWLKRSVTAKTVCFQGMVRVVMHGADRELGRETGRWRRTKTTTSLRGRSKMLLVDHLRVGTKPRCPRRHWQKLSQGINPHRRLTGHSIRAIGHLHGNATVERHRHGNKRPGVTTRMPNRTTASETRIRAQDQTQQGKPSQEKVKVNSGTRAAAEVTAEVEGKGQGHRATDSEGFKRSASRRLLWCLSRKTSATGRWKNWSTWKKMTLRN